MRVFKVRIPPLRCTRHIFSEFFTLSTVSGQHPGAMVNGAGSVCMAQDLNLHFDVMATVSDSRDL